MYFYYTLRLISSFYYFRSKSLYSYMSLYSICQISLSTLFVDLEVDEISFILPQYSMKLLR